MRAKPKILYLFQRQNISLTEAIAELESEFAETERAVAKVVHQHYGYAVEYASLHLMQKFVSFQSISRLLIIYYRKFIH